MARAITRANKIYDVAEFFAKECLLKDDSLLWPGRRVWTLENLERLWQVFILNPDTSDKSFIDKWSEQLSGSSDDVYRMATEAAVVYSLFPYYQQMGPTSKKKFITEVRSMGPELGEFDENRWLLVEEALNEDGIAKAGTDYLTRRPFHIGYYLAFALEIKRRRVTSLDDVNPLDLVDHVLEWASKDMEFRANGSRNAVLNLFWPSDFEPTASNAHKQQMAENLSDRFNLTPLGNVDATILQARRHMEINGFEKDFDMYSDQVQPLWASKNAGSPRPVASVSKKLDKARENSEFSESEEIDAIEFHPPTITDLAKQTFLDEAHLTDIESLLKSKKQLIFEGPPGSGKTYVAEKFARYFTGQPLTGERNDRVELVQFHQSYSYEDFVEGIRPESINGQLHYNVKPGIFREFAARASSDPDNNYVLIIDEINRGNVSRILGELMLLLEYREEKAKLPYSQEYLEIPPNLYIIGTMNSADRSLSQIDYALRRRFYFVRFLSVENGEANVLRRWLDTQDLDANQRHRILHTFIELNAQLRSHLDTDDLQIGHSYFMNANIGNEHFRKQVWKYAVIPLIREYLYHHRDRDELLQSYELQRLISIVQPIADETGEPTERLINESSGEMQE